MVGTESWLLKDKVIGWNLHACAGILFSSSTRTGFCYSQNAASHAVQALEAQQNKLRQQHQEVELWKVHSSKEALKRQMRLFDNLQHADKACGDVKDATSMPILTSMLNPTR
ncbi:hypothetical protein CCR75_004270 [Bremia lactucae]|uniref:Uncharacterized protein n=1 Tax=Bremia lactucae TaxID=4779 RepID=A0A976FKJ6_BRELC|nr:hypothetical protein CCR75_004270 [Bremia lactucae]